ncbi:MAG: hypothetical protein WBA74_27710 [Cyclobacteriaceae bacterium]
MKAFLLYNVEVFICLVVFYLFYFVSLRRETNQYFVRAYLLVAIGVSFVIPLLPFGLLTTSISEVIPTLNLRDVIVTDATGEPVAPEDIAASVNWFYVYAFVGSVLYGFLTGNFQNTADQKDPEVSVE